MKGQRRLSALIDNYLRTPNCFLLLLSFGQHRSFSVKLQNPAIRRPKPRIRLTPRVDLIVSMPEMKLRLGEKRIQADVLVILWIVLRCASQFPFKFWLVAL